MRFTTFLIVCFSFLAAQVWGQTSAEKQVALRVVVDTLGIEKVNVLNIRSNQNTITNQKGVCVVRVKTGDVLVITAVNLETRRHEITADEFESGSAIQKMSYRITPLEEVNVNENANINETSLGIVSANQKKYTPATRKLRTAQTGLLDPLLNKMSGRTRDLKKQVKVEEKEKLLLKLDGLYEEKYYTDVLKIAPEAIPGFQYYLIDDPEFAAALKAKNKTLTMFYVKRLALQYNEILLRESHEQETQPQ
ncbi:MAG: hypothetical protein RLZ77_999 [Bacteroidota bacterium]|jgi:hypothetical protein